MTDGVGYTSKTLTPTRALAPFIDHYTMIEAPGPTSPDSHGVMFPLGYAMIEFNLGARWKKGPAREAQPGTIGSNITSFTQTPFRIQPAGRVRTVVARLHPLGLRYILGDDVTTDSVFDPHMVLGSPFREAEERVAEATSFKTLKNCLDSYFLTVFRDTKISVDARVAEVWRQIVGTGGNARLGEVTKQTGLSLKRMEQLFRAHFGMTPKAYSGIARFQKVLAMYSPTQNLTSLGHSGGYYDQSHFVRHFRSLTDATPTEFFATQCIHTCKISNLYNRVG